MTAISKNTQMSKRNMLANSFHPSMFLYGSAKVLKNTVVPLTAGTLLQRISARNRSPKLKTVFGRGFEYVVAFHGWHHNNSICIGGSKSDKSDHLKQEIKKAIVDVVSG